MQFGQNKIRDKETDNLCQSLGAVLLDQGAKNKLERRQKNNVRQIDSSNFGEVGAERGGFSSSYKRHIESCELQEQDFNNASLRAIK